MSSDIHARARLLADDALITGLSESDERWLRGHLVTCSQCTEYSQTTSQILQTLRSLSFETRRVTVPLPQPATRPSRRLALAAAMLLALCAPPIYQSVRERQIAANTEISDQQLLDRIDANVSRSIPEALSPLGRGESR